MTIKGERHHVELTLMRSTFSSQWFLDFEFHRWVQFLNNLEGKQDWQTSFVK